MTARGSLFRRVLLSACGGLLLLAAGCGDSSLAGSEVENEFTVVALHSDGRPAVGARVAVVPSDYSVSVPGTGRVDSATVKADGTIGFDDMPSGTYNIIASQGDQAALVSGVTLSHEKRTVRATLAPLAVLRGTVKLDTAPALRSVRVEMVGTLASVPLADDGSFVLEVPAGQHSALRMVAAYGLGVSEHPLSRPVPSGISSLGEVVFLPLNQIEIAKLPYDQNGKLQTISGPLGSLPFQWNSPWGEVYRGHWKFDLHQLMRYWRTVSQDDLKADSGVVFTIPAFTTGSFGMLFDSTVVFPGFWGSGFGAMVSGSDYSVKVCQRARFADEQVCLDPIAPNQRADGSTVYVASIFPQTKGSAVFGKRLVQSVFLRIATGSQPVRVAVRSFYLN